MFWELIFLLIATMGNAAGLKIWRKSDWQCYVAENKEKMVLKAVKDGISSGCLIFANRYAVKRALKLAQGFKTTKLNSRAIDLIIKNCSLTEENEWFSDSTDYNYGIFDGLAIYPGTKWCGAGDIADDYDDLGPEVETDKCCREHDHCNDSITAFSSKYGLDNNAPYTKSHCDCDEKFSSCLRNANTKTSNRVGNIFFNYLQMQCFQLEYPIIDCNRHIGVIRRRCQEYELDEDQEKKWQFFDAKEYVPVSEDGKKAAKMYEIECLPELYQFPQRLLLLSFNSLCIGSAQNVLKRATFRDMK